MIKHLITGGCSFSTGGDTHNWTGCVTRYLKNLNPKLTTDHTAEISQGQELIQKKVIFAITEALNQGYKGDEILVCVMWSGIGRKAWYIDNPVYIEKLVQGWKKFQGGISSQFIKLTDYKNNRSLPDIINTKVCTTMGDFKGGWYYTVDGSDSVVPGFKEHYLLDSHPAGPGKINIGLENVIFLQNFCQLHNIKYVNQVYMTQVFNDIYDQKDHQAIAYLYNQIDLENFVKEGVLDFVLSQYNVSYKNYSTMSEKSRKLLQQSDKLLEDDLFHPNDRGYKLYYQSILHHYIERIIND